MSLNSRTQKIRKPKSISQVVINHFRLRQVTEDYFLETDFTESDLKRIIGASRGEADGKYISKPKQAGGKTYDEYLAEAGLTRKKRYL